MMNYIFLLILALFSNDPDPQYPGCINGVGHTKNRVLYSIPDTTGLNYSFDSTLNSRMGVVSIFIDTFEYLVIPSGMDTLVWNCVRCDSIQHTPSDSINYLVRVKYDPKDLSPDAVNWGDLYLTTAGYSNIQKITGIDDDILLQVEYTGDISSEEEFILYVNDINNLSGGTAYPIESSGQQVMVPNDKYVFFYVNGYEHTINIDVEVKNASDSNTILDAIKIAIQHDQGGGG